jgi:hypothetical protein
MENKSVEDVLIIFLCYDLWNKWIWNIVRDCIDILSEIFPIEYRFIKNSSAFQCKV